MAADYGYREYRGISVGCCWCFDDDDGSCSGLLIEIWRSVVVDDGRGSCGC